MPLSVAVHWPKRKANARAIADTDKIMENSMLINMMIPTKHKTSKLHASDLEARCPVFKRIIIAIPGLPGTVSDEA